MADPQLYHDLFQHMPIGILVWHLNDLTDINSFQLVEINPTACQILGITCDSNDCLSQNSHPADPFPAFLKIDSPQIYADIIRTGEARDLGQVRYRQQQQQEQVFHLLAFPLPQQQVAVLLQDVSDRHQSAEALRQLERKLLFYLQQTPLAVIEWNLQGEIIEWNSAAESMFGYPRREALGQTVDLIVAAGTQHPLKQVWSALINRRGGTYSTSTNVTSDGRSIICDWHNTPLADEEGHILGVISLVEDVTQQQEAESAVRASEARYRRLFEAAQDGILILDANTALITDANPVILILLGQSKEQLLGKQLWQIGLFPNRETCQAMMQTLREQGSLRCDNLAFRTANQRTIEIEFLGNLYMVGRSHVIQCNIRDITERKQIEFELRQLTHNLERSNRELQDFAFVASHDLQEPLRKIHSFGDRLQARCFDLLSEEGRDYLERMQSAARRMQNLINDLLSFSRVTTKAQPFVSVNLNTIVQEVLCDLEIHIQQVNAQIQIEPLPVLEADPLQMRQLFQNLLSNALKFHQPHLTPSIQILSQRLSQTTRHPLSTQPDFREFCQISICDNGIGFDEKYSDRIFTVFQRLHGRNEYEGTGMGLAICRKIVEHHNGQITAKSSIGQGSTFIVTLPIHQGVNKED